MHRVRSAVRLLVGVAGLFLAGNTVWLAVTTNFNLGVVLQGGLAAMLLVYAAVDRLSRLKPVNLAGLALLAVLAGVVGGLAGTGLTDTASGDEDVLIVLGAAVHGREVSPALARRLDVAVDFHAHNPGALLVVTGGQGPQEDIPEAVAAREYLLAHGVSEDRILVEDRSTSTQENFEFAQDVLAPHRDAQMTSAFVTSEFHVWRAGQIALRTGLDATHLHADTLWYVRPSSYLREAVAVAHFLLTSSGDS